jgi:c-mer proto-oncogene tyrosine kinase
MEFWATLVIRCPQRGSVFNYLCLFENSLLIILLPIQRVSDTKTILIGDFGLAEDLYSRDQKQCEVRLPVKWMPPESLRNGVSNERTDMWSYGVTCWEVFSLGRSPYPGIENHEILQHISSGGRLKKPTLCPDKLYEIVGACWQYNPRDRPSFKEMALTLRQFWKYFQPQLTT